MDQAGLHNELSTLERQVQWLLSEYKAAQQTITQLESENQSLKSNLKDKEALIQDFQNQDKIHKIVGSIGNDEAEASELREKIDEYIKEIDKCIVHLTR